MNGYKVLFTTATLLMPSCLLLSASFFSCCARSRESSRTRTVTHVQIESRTIPSSKSAKSTVVLKTVNPIASRPRDTVVTRHKKSVSSCSDRRPFSPRPPHITLNDDNRVTIKIIETQYE